MNNRMKTVFSALAENEAFARSAAAAFVMPLDPTVEELTLAVDLLCICVQLAAVEKILADRA